MSRTCEGIEFLDQLNASLNKTLRHLILDLEDAHFINIDLNWSRSSFAIIYPKKYEESATEKIANLGAYLHKQYGDEVLASLPSETQEHISEITWDDTTGRPLSKLDRELDEIIEESNQPEFVDISLLTDSSERPINPAPSNTFIPQIDEQSVSTFGTITPCKLSPNSSNKQTTTTLSPSSSDDNTIMSEMTLDSRVSKIESKFDNIESLLHVLVNQKQQSAMASPPLTLNDAGAEKSAPASGE